MIGICGIVQKGGLAAPERSDDNKKGIVVEKAKSGRSNGCHVPKYVSDSGYTKNSLTAMSICLHSCMRKNHYSDIDFFNC